MVLHAGVVERGKAAKAGPDVNVRLGAELFEGLFHARVLVQRLDKGPDGIERRGIHLLGKILVVAGRETLVNPVAVVGKIELGDPNKEVIGPEAVEGGEPGFGGVEVLFEGSDVG
jgi:hypothetical protein